MSLVEEDVARKDSRHGCYVISRSNPSTTVSQISIIGAANLWFCASLLFGANNSQICKNDNASRLAEMKKHILKAWLTSHRPPVTGHITNSCDILSRQVAMSKVRQCFLWRSYCTMHRGFAELVRHTHTNTSGTQNIISAGWEYVDLWHQKMDRMLAELQIHSTHKWKSGTLYSASA